ncbi:MAG: hypoxanthine phosphoribosyltransferase [Kiritimatiellia bacterium]|jgi:hypoxanthine phosphoribosyltransferase
MKTLFDADTLKHRIAELGAKIRADYGDKTIVAVCVLKGSILFTADLVRAIGGDVRIEFLGVSSYKGTKSTGQVRITHDLKDSVRGKHVLIVEDIVDTGLTLEYLIATLNMREPASLKVATLLSKPAHRTVDIEADYRGFVIDDHFVVGYGLDLDERYRNLPCIGIYEPGIDE